jgi:hypothetical protein
VRVRGRRRKGHFEVPPYSPDTIRSVYHVRELEVYRLAQLREPVDVMLSHDWPRGIYHHGDMAKLLRAKPFFREVPACLRGLSRPTGPVHVQAIIRHLPSLSPPRARPFQAVCSSYMVLGWLACSSRRWAVLCCAALRRSARATPWAAWRRSSCCSSSSRPSGSAATSTASSPRSSGTKTRTAGTVARPSLS